MGILATVQATAGTKSAYIQIDDEAIYASLVVDVGANLVGYAKVQISNDPKSYNGYPVVVSTAAQVPNVVHWADHDQLNNITANVASNIAYLPQWLRIDATNVVSGGPITLSVRTRSAQSLTA